MVLTPLLLAACSDDSDKPQPIASPDARTLLQALPSQAEPAAPPAPAEDTGSVPLRQTPQGLVGPTGTEPSPPVASAAPASPQEPDDGTPTEAEVRALYEGVIYTYVFDACGLPLIGERARQDIEQRIEVCPNPASRKDAFRTVYHRAVEVAEQDPEKMRASASKACPDKHEFLRRVMSHASELTFDENRLPDCSVLSPTPPGGPPANPPASAADPARAGKPF
jgi:DNA-binding transcriptional regulator/RsmH inhibitor MraZ